MVAATAAPIIYEPARSSHNYVTPLSRSGPASSLANAQAADMRGLT